MPPVILATRLSDIEFFRYSILSNKVFIIVFVTFFNWSVSEAFFFVSKVLEKVLILVVFDNGIRYFFWPLLIFVPFWAGIDIEYSLLFEVGIGIDYSILFNVIV